MNCATQTGQQSSVLCPLLSCFTSTAFTSGWRDEEKKREEETETEREGEREREKASCFTGLCTVGSEDFQTSLNYFHFINFNLFMQSPLR